MISPCQKERFRLRVSPEDWGFSLIELIAALSVLTMGLLGAVHLYYRGMDAMRTVREASLVSTAIRNEVETLRAAPFSELARGARQPFKSVTPGLDSLVNLQKSVTIEDALDTNLRLKWITVEAVWSGEHGRTIRQSATTLIADRGAP